VSAESILADLQAGLAYRNRKLAEIFT